MSKQEKIKTDKKLSKDNIGNTKNKIKKDANAVRVYLPQNTIPWYLNGSDYPSEKYDWFNNHYNKDIYYDTVVQFIDQFNIKIIIDKEHAPIEIDTLALEFLNSSGLKKHYFVVNKEINEGNKDNIIFTLSEDLWVNYFNPNSFKDLAILNQHARKEHKSLGFKQDVAEDIMERQENINLERYYVEAPEYLKNKKTKSSKSKKSVERILDIKSNENHEFGGNISDYRVYVNTSDFTNSHNGDFFNYDNEGYYGIDNATWQESIIRIRVRFDIKRESTALNIFVGFNTYAEEKGEGKIYHKGWGFVNHPDANYHGNEGCLSVKMPVDSKNTWYTYDHEVEYTYQDLISDFPTRTGGIFNPENKFSSVSAALNAGSTKGFKIRNIVYTIDIESMTIEENDRKYTHKGDVIGDNKWLYIFTDPKSESGISEGKTFYKNTTGDNTDYYIPYNTYVAPIKAITVMLNGEEVYLDSSSLLEYYMNNRDSYKILVSNYNPLFFTSDPESKNMELPKLNHVNNDYVYESGGIKVDFMDNSVLKKVNYYKIPLDYNHFEFEFPIEYNSNLNRFELGYIGLSENYNIPLHRLNGRYLELITTPTPNNFTESLRYRDGWLDVKFENKDEKEEGFDWINNISIPTSTDQYKDEQAINPTGLKLSHVNNTQNLIDWSSALFNRHGVNEKSLFKFSPIRGMIGRANGRNNNNLDQSNSNQIAEIKKLINANKAQTLTEKNLDSDSITIMTNDYLNFVIKHSKNKYLYGSYIDDNIKHGLDFFGNNQETFYDVNMSNFNFIKTINSINSIQGPIPIIAKEFISSKLDSGLYIRHTNTFGDYKNNEEINPEIVKKIKRKSKK